MKKQTCEDFYEYPTQAALCSFLVALLQHPRIYVTEVDMTQGHCCRGVRAFLLPCLVCLQAALRDCMHPAQAHAVAFLAQAKHSAKQLHAGVCHAHLHSSQHTVCHITGSTCHIQVLHTSKWLHRGHQAAKQMRSLSE